VIVSVSSAGERLLYIADTVFHSLHLEYPGWFPIYDIAPETAVVSKHRIFDLAAKHDILVIGHHLFPFPGLGHVAKAGDGWAWLPIKD
jgi:glyoxylase-like metal-dependent hydrolase (beta-lactamase superfamily II)